MIRVVLTGSESTGKTTLAARLATYYGAPLVTEFLREYSATKTGPLTLSDQIPTARGQIALEDAVIAGNPRLVIQDTDLLTTVIYSDHYFGTCPPWILEMAAQRLPDLYLLCEIDVEWIDDGIRDRGHMREEMQQLFRDAVAGSGAPVVSITGNWEERFQRAVDAIDNMRLSSS